MGDLIRWNPYDEFARLREEMGRFFGPVFTGQSRDVGHDARFAQYTPSVDVRETKTHVLVTAEVPGISAGDLDVTVAEDHLTIKGEARQETKSEEEGYHRMERRFGSFHRTIPLPSPVKHKEAEASYKNGLLEVRAPKADHAYEKATHLRISGGEQKRDTDSQKQLM